MPAKKKRSKGSRSPSPNTNAPKKARSSSKTPSEEQGSSSDVGVETEEDTPMTGSRPELPAAKVPIITSTPPTPIEKSSPLLAEKQEQDRLENLAKEESLKVPSTPPAAAITFGKGTAAQELASPPSIVSSTVVPVKPEDPFAPSPVNPNDLSSPTLSTSSSSNDSLNAAIVGAAEAFNAPNTPEPLFSPSTISPPRFVDGILLNSPGAKVEGLSLGIALAQPSTSNNTSDGSEPPKSPTQTSDPSNLAPPITPVAKQPPTPSTTGQLLSGIFSTPETQTTIESQNTTPSPSRPGPPPPFNLEFPAPATTPAAPVASGDGSQQSRANSSQTPPPGRAHIYFYDDGDHVESARYYPKITDNADRAATMGMHAEDDGPLRSYRSPNPPATKEPSDPSSGSKIHGTTKPREITEFQEYAEGKEGECVVLGTKALDAALKMSRERMIEHLTLVNANRELSELSNRLTEQLKSAMKEAKKRRDEGTITQHELEAAMQDERDARIATEARLKGMMDEMQRLEAVEKEYENTLLKLQNFAFDNSEFEREVAKLKREADEKEEEIRKLKEEKGDMISKEDCDNLNATKVQELQDKVAGLEKDLADGKRPQTQDDEINSAIQRFSGWIASLGKQNPSAVDAQSSSETVVSAETEILYRALLDQLQILIAGPPKDGVELNDELQKMAEKIVDLESQLTSATDINSETGYEFSAEGFMKIEEDLKELKEQLRILDVATPTGKRLEEELNAKLEYIRLLECGAPTGFDAGEDKTFIHCSEECIAEKGGLLNENQKLYRQLDDADEALRRCRVNNPKLFQNMDTPVSLREQVEELGSLLTRGVVDNKAMAEIFMKNDLHRQGTPKYNELEAQNRDFEREVEDLKTQLLDSGVVNSQLNDDIAKLHVQLTERRISQAQQVLPTALENEIATLKSSQTTLRETNQKLRDEVDPLKRKLKKTEDERTMLKDALRTDNEDAKKFERQVTQMKNDLEETIQDLETKLEESERECADAKSSLGAKIKEFALSGTKAERQRQIERTANKGAQSKENPDADASPGSNSASSSGEREDIEVTLSAMDVVFIRVELQLGQLQAERSRWGFRGNDAVNAISVAMEAQSMAERLTDPYLLGRANYWRGVAEFMAGNSAAAEQWFEESIGQPWTESEDEKELLEEWWDVSKNESVDKTIQSNPLEAFPEMQRPPPRRVRTKPGIPAEEKTSLRQAKKDKKQAKKDKKQAKKDKNDKRAADLKKKKANANQSQREEATDWKKSCTSQ